MAVNIVLNRSLPATSFGQTGQKWPSLQDLLEALQGIPEIERRRALAMRADADDGEKPILEIVLGYYENSSDPDMAVLD